jgi:glycosyltransferase involved in cell wall biosynthesis
VLPAWYPTAQQPFNGPFVRDHARAAAAYGHRAVVFVAEGPSEDVRGLFALDYEQDADLRVVRCTWRPSTHRVAYLLGVLAVARRLAREGTPVDVLHAHVHRMGWAGVLAGALLRRPTVISEHSSEWPAGTLSAAALRRARIAFRRAAVVCPVSVALRKAIECYGVRARFRVVPNAVDTATFHPPARPPAGPPTRLATVSLHVEVKGIDVLLRAFATLAGRRPELTLDLVGEGPLTPELEQLAHELGLGERVRFLGSVEPAGVAEVLRSSHVFVLSSRNENLPVALLEALCCGLPVVATNVGGVPEVVTDEGVLTQPDDPEGLAEAIGMVLDRYRQFDRPAIARRAASRFSLEAVGKDWDEIYRAV